MNVNWSAIWSGIRSFLSSTLYFLVAIVFISSFGVWIPFVQDHAQFDKIQCKTITDLPWSLVTYAIAIVAVAYIDRIDHLFKASNKYHRNYLEFMILLVLIIGSAILVYLSLTNKKFGRNESAIIYASVLTIVSWVFWIYVKAKTPKYDNYSALGGNFES